MTHISPVQRQQALSRWTAAQLQQTAIELETVSGDASFRRYFRARLNNTSYIAVDAPPEHENNQAFVMVAELLLQRGLRVPQILAVDYQQGFLLISDLGDGLYLPQLQGEQADRLYRLAIDALVQMQGAGEAQLKLLPPYDEALLWREMSLFSDWFCGTHLQLDLATEEQSLLNRVFTLLADSALQQPQVFVHRDYHSRNLMLPVDDKPGVIDFQDAVHGPITYDLVSLLRDCYIAWPQHRIDAWVDYYLSQAEKSLSVALNGESFKRWFDWMGMQRHLKAIGIFARLNHRDGKSGYLEDIPRTLNYVISVGRDYPELQQFAVFLEQRVAKKLAEKNGNANKSAWRSPQRASEPSSQEPSS